MDENTIRLSPLMRLSRTFDLEMGLDNVGVFGRETYEKYIETQQKTETKQDKISKSLFLIDALLVIAISGQSSAIPVLGIEMSSIPAVKEILLFASALAFFILCGTFITNQCYIWIIDQFGRRIVDSKLIDPDFFNASRKHFDFFLKIYRPKLNIWGVDVFKHGPVFAVFCWFIDKIIILVVLTIPIAHLALSLVAAANVFASDLNIYVKYSLLAATGFINLGALTMVIGMYTDFTFKLIEPNEEADSDMAASDVPPSSNQ